MCVSIFAARQTYIITERFADQLFADPCSCLVLLLVTWRRQSGCSMSEIQMALLLSAAV